MGNRIHNLRANAFQGQGAFALSLIFLLIEFIYELPYGIDSSILPALRADFGLTYGQVGLLLGLPHILGALVEPLTMLQGDTHLCKSLIIAGGVTLALVLSSIARATTFPVLLVAMLINYPTSGAFVSLAQVSLVDMNPGRRAQAMARWTVAGTLGNLLGPLLLAIGFSRDWGWRWSFTLIASKAFVLAILIAFNRLNAG